MRIFFYRTFILITTIFILTILYLSYFGLKTKKFDNLIKEKVNSINRITKIEFKKTKILLKIRDLKIVIKLQNPEILINNNKIDLSKFDLTLSIKSFFQSDFILDKINIAFKENSITDLTKVTSVFLPKFINKQLNKFFIKGNLSGEIIVPFKNDGSIDKNYKFHGKILNAELGLVKNYQLKNLTAEIKYGEDANLDKDNLLININKASFINLDLSGSVVDIKFKKDKKIIKALVSSKGLLNSADFKKISSLLGKNINNLKDFKLNSNLKTNIEFDINNKLNVKNIFYSTKGTIKNLEFKINNTNTIKNFLPSLNTKIILKNSKVNFVQPKEISKKQILNLDGEIAFNNKFEKINIKQSYNRKIKKHIISGVLSLNNSILNIKNLNYKKSLNKSSNVKFDISFIFDKYFLVKKLTYTEANSKILIDDLRLNKSYEVVDLNSLIVTTYKNDIINNNFLVKKKMKS